MYEMKDFQEAGDMLDYLNALPAHQIVTIQYDNNRYWRVIVKITKMGRPSAKS